MVDHAADRAEGTECGDHVRDRRAPVKSTLRVNTKEFETEEEAGTQAEGAVAVLWGE